MPHTHPEPRPDCGCHNDRPAGRVIDEGLSDAATRLLAAAARIKELDAQLASARRWAVALEQENAALLRVASIGGAA